MGQKHRFVQQEERIAEVFEVLRTDTGDQVVVIVIDYKMML